MSQDPARRTARPRLLDDDFDGLMNGFSQTLSQRPENPYEREATRGEGQEANATVAGAEAPPGPSPEPEQPRPLPVELPRTAQNSTPERRAAPASRVQMTVRIQPELRERARNVAYWLSGPPERLGFQDMFERALELLCVHLEKKHNGGRPFPPREAELKRGRRI